MFTKLLLATSAIGALSAPLPNYQHTTQEGNVQITYQYETNEVNSIDDLIVGNVYHVDLPRNEELSPSALGYNVNLYFELLNGEIHFDGSSLSGYIDEVWLPSSITGHYYISTSFQYDDIYLYTAPWGEDAYVAFFLENVDIWFGSFDFVYHDLIIDDLNDYIFDFLDYISPSTYNVITDVQEVYHTGLFGNLADFLRYHIYGGIPHVNDIQFEIANQTITMLDWLVTTTSIALAVLSLVLLFYFFRWVFKLVSGLIILR